MHMFVWIHQVRIKAFDNYQTISIVFTNEVFMLTIVWLIANNSVHCLEAACFFVCLFVFIVLFLFFIN